jgi:hypothetical protein
MPARKFIGLLQIDLEWDAEFKRRFRMLCQHYGLLEKMESKDPLFWPELTSSLIFDHVPGLGEVRGKVGRTATRKGQEAEERRVWLLAEVEKIKKARPQVSTSAALKHLLKKWKREGARHAFAGKSASYLRQEIVAARKERDRHVKGMANALLAFGPYQKSVGERASFGDPLALDELAQPLKESSAS